MSCVPYAVSRVPCPVSSIFYVLHCFVSRDAIPLRVFLPLPQPPYHPQGGRIGIVFPVFSSLVVLAWCPIKGGQPISAKLWHQNTSRTTGLVRQLRLNAKISHADQFEEKFVSILIGLRLLTRGGSGWGQDFWFASNRTFVDTFLL